MVFTESTLPTDGLEPELCAFQARLVEHLLRSPAPGRHAIRSAIRHLDRAWKLTDKMPEVSAFLAITAEEESATAVFHSLMRHRYQGAERLRSKDHFHKTALHPFLLAVGRAVKDIPIHNPRFIFNNDPPSDDERLWFQFTVSGPNGEQLCAQPLPPLEFTISVDGRVHDFAQELAELASEKNAKDIQNHVAKLKNRRNKMLYAAPDGIPHATEEIGPFLRYRRSVVFSHFVAYLLIDPYPVRQLFVQQTLDAFLKVVEKLRVNAENTPRAI